MKTILITGATDGIGLETARVLAREGHTLLLHGRNAAKLAAAERDLSALPGAGSVESFKADLSSLGQTRALAADVRAKHDRLDVLINNAGVYNSPSPITADGLDVRFVVNTVAPYLLTRELLPLLGPDGRVVNLSSAAQAPVSLDALAGTARLSDGEAYAQSKLALTMWSEHLGRERGAAGPVFLAVNPSSLLDTKMVREAFGTTRGGAEVGADILRRAALDAEFADKTGQYFDNDSGRFAPPHPAGRDPLSIAAVVQAIEALI